MARHVTALAVFVFGVFVSAADPEKPADRAKTLIDKLTEVDEQDTGYSGSDSGTSFLPLNRNEWQGGLISPRQGKFGSADAMKSLVKMGVDAVPELLKHLSDDRKTKIVLSHQGGFGGMFIGQDDEEKKDDKKENKKEDDKDFFRRNETKYTVMVGDLCYVALGQIVNRPYTAVRYQPTAIIYVTCVPKSKKLREELTKEWGKLTADSHRESLVKDFASADYRTFTGASVRLAYYHPDTFEPLALKQLAQPTYDWQAVRDLLDDKLYPAKSAKERKELVDQFVKKRGEVAREGLRWELFDDLPKLGSDDHIPARTDRDETKARECLSQVFGYPKEVTRKDRPAEVPVDESVVASLVHTLRYDRSEKIDKAVVDLLTKTDDEDMGMWCIDRLAGRRYDAQIEAFLKRILPKLKGWRRDVLQSYEAKLGWTRLHAAVELDVPELVEAALKEKLDVNAKAKDGRTALHLAAADGKLTVVEQLLLAKADVSVKDLKGKLAVQLAAFADAPDVVRRLVAAKGGVPDVLVAATVGDADRLAELIKTDPTAKKTRTEYGFTPLHVAVREGHEKATGVLIAAGADVNAVDLMDGQEKPREGFTPLHLAAIAGKAGVVKLLLDKGAEVNTADTGKFTPLYYAAALGHTDVVKVLLDRKADREKAGNDGHTPLEIAKERKHTAVVKLLEAGK